ncbi:Phage tail sheath protein [compost metagenome]
MTDGAAVLLETKVGDDEATAATDLSLNLTDGRFPTIDELISYLSAVSNYTADYVDVTSSGLATAMLDAQADLNIKTTAYLSSAKGDTEHRINGASALVTVTATTPLTNFDLTYLTGAASGATPASWSAYFDSLKLQFSDLLVLLTDSETIHAEGLSHVGEMVSRNQKQVMFTGGGTGESVQRTKQRAAGMNNSRAVLAYPGIYHRSHLEGRVAMPAYFLAAMLAGRVAGVSASEPITFDYFSVLGLENDMLAGDPDINDLITSGVATLERVQNGGFRLVQGITTYTGANNSLYREISVRRGADKLSESVRKTLEDRFVGAKGLASSAASVVTSVVDVLEKAVKDGDILSYRNIVVRIESSVVYVDYQVAPVEPNNYILITSHFVPESISATL